MFAAMNAMAQSARLISGYDTGLAGSLCQHASSINEAANPI